MTALAVEFTRLGYKIGWIYLAWPATQGFARRGGRPRRGRSSRRCR